MAHKDLCDSHGKIFRPRLHIVQIIAHTIPTTNKEENTLKKVFNVFSVIALILTIVGALNWLTVGIFGFNFVNFITFGMVWLERLLYILVGIAGIFMIVWLCVSRFNMVENDNTYRDYKYADRHNGHHTVSDNQ